MSKWKCEICGSSFDNFQAQGFDNKVYCPLCYFKKLSADLQVENFKLKDKLGKQRKEYQETYKDVRKEIKDYKKQLQQRDELINKAKEFIEHYRYYIKLPDGRDYPKDLETKFAELDKWQVDELIDILNIKEVTNENK